MLHSGLGLKAPLPKVPGLGPVAAGDWARIMLMGFSKPSNLQGQCHSPVTLPEESGYGPGKN